MPELPAVACIRSSYLRTRAAPGASHLSELINLAVERELDEARVLNVDEPADRLVFYLFLYPDPMCPTDYNRVSKARWVTSKV